MAMAFLLPVMMVAVMMFCELARMGIITTLANSALDKAVAATRSNEAAPSRQAVERRVEHVVIAQSHGYFTDQDISVQVMGYPALSLSQDTPHAPADLGNSHQADSPPFDTPLPPAFSITLSVSKPFLTPLPALLTLGQRFRYESFRVVGTNETP